jgi:hypothetical protein
MSPIRGPLVTARMCSAVTRPRSASGVASWTTVDRKTAESTSAAPAIARNMRARGKKKVDSPNAVIASPQMITARTTARPTRRTTDTQPDSSAPRNAPIAGAAARRPSPAGPTRNTSRARTGKSDVGIPKIMASRSMTKVASITRRSIANRNPSRIAARPGRVVPPSGGSGAILHTAKIDAANDRTSTPYAAGRPATAIRTPPTAGPTTDAAWKFSWLRAIAAGRRSGGTSRGMDEERAGWSNVPSVEATNATMKMAISGGLGTSARATKARLQAANPSCVINSRRRRSTASTIEPAPTTNTRIGTSWTAVSAAIARVEWVRIQTWKGKARRVSWLPIPETT